MKEMLFLTANAVGLSPGSVTSTARKGMKWADQAKVGDVVALMHAENRHVFGRAVISKLESSTFADVVARYRENHDTRMTPEGLQEALEGAYGKMDAQEPFTIVGLVVLQPE